MQLIYSKVIESSKTGIFPASYHGGAGSLTFADGHAEIKKWLSNTTKVPVRYGWQSTPFDEAGRRDFQWLQDRSAIRL
jgi:prepilin-type processing-associated H-X9-DG protein